MCVFLNTVSLIFFKFSVSSNPLDMHLKEEKGRQYYLEVANKYFEDKNPQILFSQKQTNPKNRRYEVEKWHFLTKQEVSL